VALRQSLAAAVQRSPDGSADRSNARPDRSEVPWWQANSSRDGPARYLAVMPPSIFQQRDALRFACVIACCNFQVNWAGGLIQKAVVVDKCFVSRNALSVVTYASPGASRSKRVRDTPRASRKRLVPSASRIYRGSLAGGEPGQTFAT
jgi:hypothetical protein